MKLIFKQRKIISHVSYIKHMWQKDNYSEDIVLFIDLKSAVSCKNFNGDITS